ncbi:MAG: DUF11 domain-containing protein, partial [Ardenticatenales bacterium]|nr:DUF11 domain-containing protein [Ardenticatenales bacterium]
TTGTLNITGTAPSDPTVWQFRTAVHSGSGDFPPSNSPFGPGNDQTLALALGDLDGDGDLDIAVGNWESKNYTYLNNGYGRFDSTGNLFGTGVDKTRAIALGDMDGDGDLDAVVANDGQQSRVYLNDGDGSFASTGNPFGPSNDPTRALALGDLDGDGDLDIAVGNYNGQNYAYLNGGDGSLSPTGNAFGPGGDPTRALALGDLDGDGDLDIAVGNYGGQNYAYLNNSDGSFSPTGNSFGPAADATYAVVLGDLDGDGDLDDASGNYNQQNYAYLNNGDGSLSPTGKLFGPGDDATRAVALGDLDGDGDLDAAVGNQLYQNYAYRYSRLADVQITQSVEPLWTSDPGDPVTFTLEYGNQGILTASGVVITDVIPAGITNLDVTSSGPVITPRLGQPYVWDVPDLAPGAAGVITITGDLPMTPCTRLVNTAEIGSASPDELPGNNQHSVSFSIDLFLYVESLDPGSALQVNGSPAGVGSEFCFEPGETANLETSYNGETYQDVIEVHYDIDLAVHAASYATSPGTIYLDGDLGYTPYDIFIVESADTAPFTFDMANPPAGDAVKIIGLHAMVPNAVIGELGNPDHSGTPRELAEVFYGTVENNGTLHIATTCRSEIGSAFNKIVANEVVFSTVCEGYADVMIQELYAGDRVESIDTEISWWRMEVTGQFYVDDYEGYSLNDELPELVSLQDDPMLWFKARNPAKWNLPPLIKIDGQGYDRAWEFDNYEYEDYNFWEMQLGGDFYWYNDEDYIEYAHFLGPVMEMDSFFWEPVDDLYLNFFGDSYDNCYDEYRFDGDDGSAGEDFWNPLLTSDYGYTEVGDGNIVSPVFAFRLREGYFEAGYSSYYTYLHLAEDQDLLILSDTDGLEFHNGGSDFDFDQGANSHWVVEDGLVYTGTVPTDDAFNITLVDFSAGTDGAVTVVATNDYGPGDATSSTMYLAHRRADAYGQQLSKLPMSYDGDSGQWSVATQLSEDGRYDLYVVAVENDGI